MHDESEWTSDAVADIVAVEVEKAVAAEREACAQIADLWATTEQRQLGLGPGSAIRARGRGRAQSMWAPSIQPNVPHLQAVEPHDDEPAYAPL